MLAGIIAAIGLQFQRQLETQQGHIVGVIVVFSALTMATFIGLTVLATLAGYQMKGEWLEHNANTITALVLVAIGIGAYIGF